MPRRAISGRRMKSAAGTWTRWAWLFLVALVAVLFARTLRFGLFQDDYILARPWTWSEVLGTFHGPFDPTRYAEAYFRPWASVSFALQWSLWGTNLWGYHLLNLVLPRRSRRCRCGLSCGECVCRGGRH